MTTCPNCGVYVYEHWTRCGKCYHLSEAKKVFTIDYDLIRKVMHQMNDLGDDSDSDCACRRVYCRMLAEATGMPLAGFRLICEKEVTPKYRKDYVLAPNMKISKTN